MSALDNLQTWYSGLMPRERYFVLAASACVALTLFYIALWEPLTMGVRDVQQRNITQHDILAWMRSAAAEAKQLQSSGGGVTVRDTNQPVTLVVERSASTAGLKKYLSKIESAAEKGARVTVDAVSFDQMLVWLNTLEKQYGINVISADIDRDKEAGLVNARLTLNRS